MTKEQKVTWIQYFQYLHSLWGEKFSTQLSLGQCVDKLMEDNVIIGKFIEIFYRYKPFETTVTNAYSISFEFNIPEDSDFELTYVQNGTTLFTFFDTKDQLLSYIVTELNSTGDLIAFEKDGVIYVYTYDNSYTFADLPTLTFVMFDPDEEVTAQVTTLENRTDEILNLMNCLTLQEMCELKRKLLVLLNNCSC